MNTFNQPEKERFFHNVYDTIKSDLLKDFTSEGMPPESVKWYERNIDYNLPGGKLNRGLAIIDTIDCLKQGAGITEAEHFKAAVLGWCVELIQAYLLVLDDFTDSSVTRRGQPCYYHVVGNVSINDACLLKSAVFVLLRKYFSQEECYVHLLDLVCDVGVFWFVL
jgi:farnesyl diphosphate synthase